MSISLLCRQPWRHQQCQADSSLDSKTAIRKQCRYSVSASFGSRGGKTFQFEHVKSHQDDTVDVSELPFSAQLNVECDKLATEHLQQQQVAPAEATLANPLPLRNHTVEVRHGTQVFSSHYATRLRTAVSSKVHRRYLQTKYKWSPLVWESIAWDAFLYCGSRKVIAHPVTRCKVVHNWLNLGAQRAKIGRCPDSALESRCPYCDQSETFVHLLTCSAPRAQKFRYDGLLVLGKALSGSQSGSALLGSLKAWLLAPTAEVKITPATVRLAPAIVEALASQALIGWEHLFRRFVSSAWLGLHMVSKQTETTDGYAQASSEVARMIAALQDFTIYVWHHRNNVLHETGSPEREALHATLNHNITQMYHLRESFAPIVHSYFDMSREDRLCRSPRQRSRWLQLVQLTTTHSSAMGSRQALVSHYFPYAADSLETALPLPSVAGLLPVSIPPPFRALTNVSAQQQALITQFLPTTSGEVS